MGLDALLIMSAKNGGDLSLDARLHHRIGVGRGVFGVERQIWHPQQIPESTVLSPAWNGEVRSAETKCQLQLSLSLKFAYLLASVQTQPLILTYICAYTCTCTKATPTPTTTTTCIFAFDDPKERSQRITWPCISSPTASFTPSCPHPSSSSE